MHTPWNVRSAAWLLLLLSCGPATMSVDSGVTERSDAGRLDAGVVDAGTLDAGRADAGFDAGSHLDSGVDAGALDAGSDVDSGVADAGARDAGSIFDSGVADSGVRDSGAVDSGTTDAGPRDAGFVCPARDAGGAFTSQDSIDFLTQDVCLNSAGAVTADDPATCACHRDLQLDELVPLHKVDQGDPNNPFGFQLSDSVPFRLGTGVGVLQTFDFAFAEGPNPPYRAFFEFDRVGGFSATDPLAGAPIDGYDIAEYAGPRVSYVGTCDSGGRVQLMWGWLNGMAGQCRLDDAWLLFNQQTVSSTLMSEVARLRINAPSMTCPTDFLSDAFTDFQLVPFTYTTGKTLQTLVSNHFGGSSIATADHLERFFHTREYGKTRWERWQLTGAPKASGCNGSTSAVMGGQTFIRVDCRDWSSVLPDPRGGFEPRTWPLDLRIGFGNLLVNADFGAGVSYLGPWDRQGNQPDRSIVELNDPMNVQHRGRHLAVVWNGTGSNVISQSVANPSLAVGTRVGFGALVWSNSSNAPITVRVVQLDAGGTALATQSLTQNTSATPTRVSGGFQVVTGATRFQLEVVASQANALYSFDDAWLTPMP